MNFPSSQVNDDPFYYLIINVNADQREKLIASKRAFTDEKVNEIVAFKKKLCDGTNKNFVIVNQKDIDPPSLKILARASIIGIRRAKKRNGESIPSLVVERCLIHSTICKNLILVSLKLSTSKLLVKINILSSMVSNILSLALF